MAVRWQDPFQGLPVGSTNPNANGGFNHSGEYQGGGGAQIVDIGSGLKACRFTLPVGSGTQRSELIPNVSGATAGQTRCFAFRLRASLGQVGAGSAWGPLFTQHRRSCSLGNGPISGETRIGTGLFVCGWSGTTSPSFVTARSSVPTAAFVHFALRIFHSTTDGWIETYIDNTLVSRVEPWQSKDTSADGPGSTGSTLSNCATNTFKFGIYRGGSTGSTVVYDFYDVVIGDTLADVDVTTGGGGGGTPVVPGGLRVTGTGSGFADLDWNDLAAADFPTGSVYQVYYGTTPAGVTRIAGDPAGRTSALRVTGLSNGTTYYFRVSQGPVNGQHSPWTPDADVVSATPTAIGSGGLSAPTGLSASMVTDDVSLDWDDS